MADTTNASTVGFQTQSFAVEVNAASGTFTLIDRITGRRWGDDPWMNTAGIISLNGPQGGRRDVSLSNARDIQVERQGEACISISFGGLVSEKNETIDAVLRSRIKADEEGSIRVEVLSLELPQGWAFLELEYPCRVGALITDVDAGYMVTPYFQGSLVPSTVKKWKEIPQLTVFAWDDAQWTDQGGADIPISGWASNSLPFWGAVDGKSALMCLIETENDASLRFVLNSNCQFKYSRVGELSPYRPIAVTSPIWLAEKEQLGYARSIRYISLPGGNYLTMAKRYRRFAKERGLLVTLREKMERTPDLDRLIGGPWVTLAGSYPHVVDQAPWRYTWKDARKIVDDLCDFAGAKYGQLHLCIGYSRLPPHNHPFHPAQGPLEDLQELVVYAKSRNILINFYHGYPALLEEDPEGNFAEARKQTRGGNMYQRWGRLCPHFYMKYAQETLPLVLRDSGIVCEYSDMLTATHLYECWDERHPLTRSEDRRLREELMQYSNSLGIFSGSEWPVHYGMPYLTWFRNGNASAGSRGPLSAMPVPLLNLVFKDCALMYGAFLPRADSGMLRDQAAGCHMQAGFFSIHDYYADAHNRTRHGLRTLLDLFQEWDRLTGLEELVSHEFVEELNGPYITRFSDGSEALTNLTIYRREVDGVVLEPESMLMRMSNGKTVRASPKQGWNLEKQSD